MENHNSNATQIAPEQKQETEETHKIFVYGTLRERNNKHQSTSKRTIGTILGRMFDVAGGAYPGIRIDPDLSKNYIIHGEILEDISTSQLESTDRYEGCVLDEPEHSLYIRERIPVTTEKGIEECWVYIFNRSIDGQPEIVHGEWLQYRSLSYHR